MSADASIESRLRSGEVWADFCDSLRATGQRVLASRTPDSALDHAEGFRCLTRFLRAGLESFVEHGDPDRPNFSCLCHETIKIIADNPDVHYQSCTLRSEHDYRIVGNRGSVNYISFGTQGGDYGRSGTMDPTGFIDSNSLRVEADGSFEIIVSRRERSRNWLPMTEDSNKLIVRQTFLDRSSETRAELEIHRLGSPLPSRPLDANRFVRRLEDAARFVDGTAELAFGWAGQLQARPNELPAADQAYCRALGGDPNFFYYHGYWRLDEDEALLIEVDEVPDCQSWNFQLDNYWMESLDYRHHRIHLNKHLATERGDGGLTLIVAHEDPGLPNWIETVGHTEGTMCFRWVRSSSHPPITCRVARLAELHRSL